MKGQVEFCFVPLNILVRFLINLSREDFYTTLPHNLIKEKIIDLTEWTFQWEGSPYLA